MNSHDYLGLEMQQLFNENDTPYVSSRERSNPFVHFGDGVDVEEIFEDDEKPKSFFQSTCSYVPMAKRALDMTERACNLFGSGCCAMCRGGCSDCPYCSGISGISGGYITVEYTRDVTPNIDSNFINKNILSANKPYNAFNQVLLSRYGMNSKDPQLFTKFVSENMDGKVNYFANLDRLRDILQENRRKESELLKPQRQEEDIGYVTTISPNPVEITKSVVDKIKEFINKNNTGRVIDFLSNVKVNENVRKIAKTLLERKLEEQNKKELEDIARSTAITEKERSIIDMVKSVFSVVEQRAPLKEIKKITTKTEAEQAKQEIKETYAQCLQRFQPGEKVKNCVHLTKPYIQRKLLQAELQKYKSYADCMADKGILKGHRRETCHKFTKGFRRENPDLFEQDTVNVPQVEPHEPPKYKSYFDCMADKEIPKGTRRTTCHPYAMSAKVKQKESTIKRNAKIRKKAVQLRDKHPNKTYAERMKMARKQIKGGDMDNEFEF